MKIAVLVGILAVASGAAFAQTGSSSAESSATQPAAGETLIDKTKRVFRRAGDATRRTVNRVTKGRAGENDDTRNMGAAGSDSTDPGRRARMDQAYENYKSKQK